MRNQNNGGRIGLRRSGRAFEKEMFSKVRVGGLHSFSLEAQWGEHAGCQGAKTVYAGRIGCEAIDRHHLLQEIQVTGKVGLVIILYGCRISGHKSRYLSFE